jgi:hypothetical protein
LLHLFLLYLYSLELFLLPGSLFLLLSKPFSLKLSLSIFLEILYFF